MYRACRHLEPEKNGQQNTPDKSDALGVPCLQVGLSLLLVFFQQRFELLDKGALFFRNGFYVTSYHRWRRRRSDQIYRMFSPAGFQSQFAHRQKRRLTLCFSASLSSYEFAFFVRLKPIKALIIIA